MLSKTILFVVGPTAVGKSDVGLRLAQKLNGEIISCDAMQVYKEIEVASDKPSLAALKKVPHHLVNVVSVTENFDVARFRNLAIEAIEDIHRRGKLPIIVGGSGMYMSILLDGIFEGGAEDGKREELENIAANEGIEALFRKLKDVDPATAAKINPNDKRRILRALEVYQARGQPISELQRKRSGLWGKYSITIFALNRPREELYKRVEARIDHMFENGLVEEVRRIFDMKLSRSASVLIGIPEVSGFINQEYDLQRAKYLMKLHTRHYVKRQLTWFRKDKRLDWIMIDETDVTGEIIKRLEKIGSCFP